MVRNLVAGDYPMQWLRRRLMVWQLRDIRLRSDQGAPVTAVVRRVQSTRVDVKSLVEEAPVASHQSCGGVERWARLIGEEIRAMRRQLELDLGSEVGEDWPIVAWLVRCSSWFLHRFHQNRVTGTTAYQVLYSRPYLSPILPFGEVVLSRRAEDVLGTRRLSKWDCRWDDSVWLGRVEESYEHLLWTNDTVVHRRSVRRRAAGDAGRWQVSLIRAVSKTPWDLLSERSAGLVRPVPRITAGSVPPGVTEPEHLCLGVQRQLQESPAAMTPLAKRDRPKTAGCSGCYNRGKQSRGYHHSMEC